jgi:two-component system nitrate/nitrite response regulator NarL
MVTTILIADDHELFRKSLIKALKEYFPNTAFTEAATGEEVLEATKNNQPDIILLDIDMPIRNGLKTLFQLRAKNITSKVVMLTAKKEKEFVFFAKKNQANGYFTKNISPDMLAEAILRIASSNLFICSEWFLLDFHSSDHFTKKVLTKIDTLTKREREVLKYFFNGLNTNEVSEIMNIRKKSTDNYKNRILSKMENHSDIYFNDWVNKNRDVLKYLV